VGVGFFRAYSPVLRAGRVRGSLCTAGKEPTVGVLATATDEALQSGVVLLTVDLDGLDFMGAALLGTLVAARRRCRRSGVHLRVICTNPRLRRLFDITNLSEPLLRDPAGLEEQRT
jgi:anti-anti-sigma factor